METCSLSNISSTSQSITYMEYMYAFFATLPTEIRAIVVILIIIYFFYRRWLKHKEKLQEELTKRIEIIVKNLSNTSQNNIQKRRLKSRLDKKSVKTINKEIEKIFFEESMPDRQNKDA